MEEAARMALNPGTIARAQRGDGIALEAIYLEYQPRIAGYLCRLVGYLCQADAIVAAWPTVPVGMQTRLPSIDREVTPPPVPRSVSQGAPVPSRPHAESRGLGRPASRAGRARAHPRHVAIGADVLRRRAREGDGRPTALHSTGGPSAASAWR